MKSTAEQAIAVGLGSLALGAAVNAALASKVPLAFWEGWLALTAWAAIVSALSLAHARFRRLANEESQERSTQSPAQTALFSTGSDEPFTAARSLARFERFGIPSASVALALGLGAWAWIRLQRPTAPSADLQVDPLVATAFLVAEGFAFFLCSRFLIAISRDKSTAPARPAGIALGIISLATFAAAAASVASRVEGWQADRILQLLFLVAGGVLAIEQAVLVLAAFYVPVHRRLPTIQSRIGEWLTDPTGWSRSLASSVDYQFGVRSGQEALRHFLRKGVLPIVALEAVLLYGLTSLVFIEPHEVGIRERLGRPVSPEWRLDSGFHLLAPWPIETVRRVEAKRILRFDVGFEAGTASQRPATILWTVPHYSDEEIFVTAARPRGGRIDSEAAGVNVATINLSVEYRVTNTLAFAYTHRDPGELLRDCAYRVVTRTFAARDLLDLLGGGRRDFAEHVRAEIQRDADRLGIGVEIESVMDLGIHPPVPAADAFQSVIAAVEQRHARLLEARAYSASVAPRAQAETEKIRLEAEADAESVRQRAASEAAFFSSLLESDRAASAVLRQDLRLTAVRDALHDRPYTVLAHPEARKSLFFDLRGQSLPELYELAPFPLGDETP
ncbi:MAG: protease modulator HflK [Kiritimatiellae bacterium]|nr:protease modulator HflK [Kiritimatiellia bacterium]MDW8459189.1 protease modulator HflK [Verrucomicrobiota bacterium]